MKGDCLCEVLQVGSCTGMSKGRKPYNKCTDTAPGSMRSGQTLARRAGTGSSVDFVADQLDARA